MAERLAVPVLLGRDLPIEKMSAQSWSEEELQEVLHEKKEQQFAVTTRAQVREEKAEEEQRLQEEVQAQDQSRLIGDEQMSQDETVVQKQEELVEQEKAEEEQKLQEEVQAQGQSRLIGDEQMSQDERVVQKQEELVEHREQEATVTLDECQSGLDSSEKLGDIEGRLILGDVFDFSEDLFQGSKHTKRKLSRGQRRRAKRQRILSIGEKERAIYTRLKKRTWRSNTGGKKRIPLEFV